MQEAETKERKVVLQGDMDSHLLKSGVGQLLKMHPRPSLGTLSDKICFHLHLVFLGVFLMHEDSIVTHSCYLYYRKPIFAVTNTCSCEGKQSEIEFLLLCLDYT